MGPRTFIMHHCPLVPASYHKVISTQAVYTAIHVDQKYIRAIHYCGGPCSYPKPAERTHVIGRAVQNGYQCNAVHFGLCTQVDHPIRKQSTAVVRRRHPNSTRTNHRLSLKPKNKYFEDQRLLNQRFEQIAIPPFYFPNGQPVASEENEAILERLQDVFQSLPDNKASEEEMIQVTKACKCPRFWAVPLFVGAGGQEKGFVHQHTFINYWKRIIKDYHDEASRFFRIIGKPGRNFLLPEDFYLFVQDVVNCHPGLTFLQDAPEFHSRYIHTVIARIFYCVNRSWSGKITLPELKKSNLISVIALLEEEEDINQITEYFSYEHFYVIYCKFWEIDTDHDLLISKEDLARHQDQAISPKIIDRIFSPGTVLSPKSVADGLMSYTEFVFFLLSEEDKKTPMSIEYWFRCMDIDGDGYISMYEMEYFYEEQLIRMENMGIETLPFEDCLCQMLDLVKPSCGDKISLCDLKSCKLAYIFYDTFINLDKFLEHEQRDPFASTRDPNSEEPELTDWEKYAVEEYEILVAEEGGGQDDIDDQLEEGDYEDDFEPVDDIISVSIDGKPALSIDDLNKSPPFPVTGESDFH
ncbi:Serine/threonine-protein phosphatase 2A regulatory subunit B'' subunit alpha [Holothuria leucospilota]|uniref:Serine/threonine-protein phosphatase 2A regulatory subunit B'' subunit alpha n=1 Tax=Holothuria leucospilota TaxID=206669 RepID=A0A9Q1BRB8_HOLLE|nr:Serine/threonine-protein phosphatase 2A regulatory subunit B'' subunit alpha [Holothuria leucospilota]